MSSAKPWERGSVLNLACLEEDEFEQMWGVSREAAWESGFRLGAEVKAKDWFMIQVQAPCDQAQGNSGLFPYVLGLSLRHPKDRGVSKSISNKAHGRLGKLAYIWLSPALELDNEVTLLAFHFRFSLGLTRQAVGEFEVSLRLREQILSELTHEFHSYANRPGIIRFPR